MAIKFGNVEVFPPGLNIDFMKRRMLFIGISALLMLISFVVIGVRGLNYSIDFLGGSEVTVTVLDKGINRDAIVKIAEAANVGAVEVTTYGAVNLATESTYVMRIQRESGKDENATNNRTDDLVKALKSTFGEEKVKIGSVTNISGKIGKEEEIKGYLALILSFVGILLYVAYRFDSRFAPGAVLCLVHDVVIALGFMTAAGRPFSVSSIAAFLTIVGYSINDTVIVYDRIRESQSLYPRMPMVELVNKSINQTMNRTVLTSGTGLAALLVLTFFGGGAIEDFALTMFVGILVGTYSSIYVAAPLTLVMDEFLRKRGWTKDETAQKAKVEKDPNYIPPVVLKKRPVK